MTGYSEGKHNDPADTQDRLVRIGAKYQATAPTVADGDNVYVLVDSAGRVIVTGEVAHDAVDLGNPLKVGSKANTGIPAAVANGDRVALFLDEFGTVAVKLVLPTDGSDIGWSSFEADAQGVTDGGLTTRTRMYGLAPDGSADRLRTVGDAAPGLGVLAVGTKSPGAGDVVSKIARIAATSGAVQTALTPTSGKKVRILSVGFMSRGLTTNPENVQVYFGTGASILTNAANAIGAYQCGTNTSDHEAWPDGGGPVGAVDAVVSWRTQVETEGDSAGDLYLTVHYREE